MSKKVLLHSCCACCLIYPYKRLTADGYVVHALFYNPNIHPFGEYAMRRDAFEGYCRRHSIPYSVLENGIDYAADFYRYLMGFNELDLPFDVPKRCVLCWHLRLFGAGRFAKDNGFDAFSSTLLVSIYQDVDKIICLGNDAGNALGIDFIGQNFTNGFEAAHNVARQEGVYLQKWCGCLFSLQERLIHRYNRHSKADAISRIPR